MRSPKTDNQSWVGKGLACLQPEDELCLVALSAGGEDAVTLREMNLKTGKFVEGGFVLPRGKQTVAWVDKDTLLIARDWGPGTMSEAGYPITVRRWKRGQPLESAEEVFRGEHQGQRVWRQSARLHRWPGSPRHDRAAQSEHLRA